MADTPPPDQGHIVQALRTAADNVEQRLAQSSGLEPGQVTILMHLALHEPATIPDVATGVGHGYRWALAVLADLRRAGLVVRWPSNPARFALSDAGTKLAEQMNGAVWNTITSAHGWPAAVIADKVLDLLSAPADEAGPIAVPAAPTRLSKATVAAQFVGVEPHIIDAWVRSGILRPPPWDEEDLRSMNGLRGSVTAVWPELLDGARSGQKFANVANRLGITTQKVASAIWRDPALRAELDEALMQGRDPKIKHGRRLAYRQGCWCPECRTAQLGPTR
jgi:DNA-binding MarR family transcriptional regulator